MLESPSQANNYCNKFTEAKCSTLLPETCRCEPQDMFSIQKFNSSTEELKHVESSHLSEPFAKSPFLQSHKCFYNFLNTTSMPMSTETITNPLNKLHSPEVNGSTDMLEKHEGDFSTEALLFKPSAKSQSIQFPSDSRETSIPMLSKAISNTINQCHSPEVNGSTDILEKHEGDISTETLLFEPSAIGQSIQFPINLRETSLPMLTKTTKSSTINQCHSPEVNGSTNEFEKVECAVLPDVCDFLKSLLQSKEFTVTEEKNYTFSETIVSKPLDVYMSFKSDNCTSDKKIMMPDTILTDPQSLCESDKFDSNLRSSLVAADSLEVDGSTCAEYNSVVSSPDLDAEIAKCVEFLSAESIYLESCMAEMASSSSSSKNIQITATKDDLKIDENKVPSQNALKEAVSKFDEKEFNLTTNGAPMNITANDSDIFLEILENNTSITESNEDKSRFSYIVSQDDSGIFLETIRNNNIVKQFNDTTQSLKTIIENESQIIQTGNVVKEMKDDMVLNGIASAEFCENAAKNLNRDTILNAPNTTIEKTSQQILGQKTLVKGQSPNYYIEEENDIIDPGWDEIRKLSSDIERYELVKRCWESKTAPNPNKNLSYHSFRKKKLMAIPVKTQQQNRKRKASSTLVKGQNKKRPCTYVLDKAISAVSAVRKTQELEIRNKMKKKLNSISKNDYQSEASIQHSYKNQLQQCHNQFDRQFKTINYVRDEMLKFNEFYKGLHNEDPTILNVAQVLELNEMEAVYKKFKTLYRFDQTAEFFIA